MDDELARLVHGLPIQLPALASLQNLLESFGPSGSGKASIVFGLHTRTTERSDSGRQYYGTGASRQNTFGLHESQAMNSFNSL